MQLIAFDKTHSTLRSKIPVTAGVTGYRYYTQSVINIAPRSAGDMTRIHAKCEVTCILPYMVMLGSYIAFGRVVDSAKPPPYLTAGRAQDLVASMAMHYRIDEMTIVTDEDFSNNGLDLYQPNGWQASLVLYAASTAAQPGAYVTVEPASYSEMSYEHFGFEVSA